MNYFCVYCCLFDVKSNQIICKYPILFFMFGLKNLVPKGILCDENFLILKRKSQEYRRSITTFVDHLQQINKIYQNYYTVFQKNIADLSSDLVGCEDVNPRLYIEIAAIFKSVNNQLRKFIQKEASNQKPIQQLNDLFMTDYNLLVETFQLRGREYFGNEQNVVQLCKKYFKLFKVMLANIENYKNSFMDVKLIYNKDEKIKRYNECISTYRSLQTEMGVIYSKVQDLNYSKTLLTQSYQILEKQLTNFTSSFTSKFIDQLKAFYDCLVQQQRNKLQNILDKLMGFELLPLNNFFIVNNFKYQDMIGKEINPKECGICPAFIFYCQNLKEQGRYMFRRCLVGYYNDSLLKIKKRKYINKKILQYFQKYLKGLDKTLMESYKETMLNFDKMRKKVGELFGNRWILFYKIITSIFENSIQNTGRLMMKVDKKIKNIEQGIGQQANLLEAYGKELKIFIQKVVNKKIIKKYSEKTQKYDSLSQDEKSIKIQEIQEQSEFMLKLIWRYNENLSKIDQYIKSVYIGLMQDIKISMTQFYSYLNQIEQVYYQEEEYIKNYKQCHDQMIESVKKQMKFFQEIPLAQIKENSKILFDGQFNKIQGFKKIKKPKELEDSIDRNSQTFDLSCEIAQVQPKKEQNLPDQTISPKKQINKQLFLGESKGNKHAQFLIKRIDLLENQKYVKSCSCALADKIILAGRMFVTTDRIFFHSKFNSKTVLFGQTFIQIPKIDIKKIQKRSNALFFDNSLSITTIHGQMFFTSFFARNAMYDLLKSTFEVNSEQIYFQEQHINQQAENDIQMQFQDDIKQQNVKQRELIINPNLSTFNYVTVCEAQFVFPGLNVIKYLKLFQLDQEVNINRTSFSSFNYYFKDLNQHTNINIEQWNPNPLDSLNAINIKQGCPEIFTKKVNAVIPLPASGIPFMPKVSLTYEDHSLFIINKDKAVLEIIIKNTGVPYCDSFDIRMRRIIEGVSTDRVKSKTEVFVNFKEKVMVQSTIQSKTLQNTKQGVSQLNSQIKSYLKILQKKIFKNNKKQTPEEKINEQATMIDQLQNEVKTLKESNKQLGVELSQTKSSIKTGKIIIIALLVMLAIELLLLLS